MTSPDAFEQLQDQVAQGPEAVLDCLLERLQSEKKYHELFHARQMKIRHKLGLPLLRPDAEEDLTEEQRDAMEDELIEACRDCGMALLKDGHVREGWNYLRAVGNQSEVAEVLDDIEVNDETLEEIVEVALYEGVNPQLGFGLVLEHYGTCNSITTYESSMHQHPTEVQQATAGMLVRHLHDELTASVRMDISQQEESEPPEVSLKELVHDRDWLFGEHSYHVDTTHLASTVRFARIVDDKEVLRLALDLTEYGRHLSDQFQYEGDEPFADAYPAHARYFEALLGEDEAKVEEAVAFFKEKAETVDVEEHGAGAIEVYISLLSRLGRYDDAIAATQQLLEPNQDHATGFAPSLLELCKASGNFDHMLARCRENNDLLGYATGLLSKS